MILRLFVLITMVGVLNIYALSHIIHGLDPQREHLVLGWFLAFLFFLLQLAGPVGSRTFFGYLKRNKATAWLIYPLYWTSYVAFAVFSLLLAYGLLSDILSIAAYFVLPAIDKPAIDHIAFLFVLLASLGTALWGILQVRCGPRIDRVTVAIPNLPAAFVGFTIVQISDLHIGPIVNKRYVDRVVQLANAEKPDMVALTGDIVDSDLRVHSAEVAKLAEIVSKHGSYFVTGNHEYYWDTTAINRAMRVLGIHVLENTHMVLTEGAAQLVVAGVNDISTRGSDSPEDCDPVAALQDTPDGAPRILLAHQPVTYALLDKHRLHVDLQLSGHTHGGQFFPYTFLIRYFQKYYRGLYRHEGAGGVTQIYVNRGTGFWGPPLRAGAPAEITVLTLAAA